MLFRCNRGGFGPIYSQLATSTCRTRWPRGGLRFTIYCNNNFSCKEKLTKEAIGGFAPKPPRGGKPPRPPSLRDFFLINDFSLQRKVNKRKQSGVSPPNPHPSLNKLSSGLFNHPSDESSRASPSHKVKFCCTNRSKASFAARSVPDLAIQLGRGERSSPRLKGASALIFAQSIKPWFLEQKPI